jgi:hypothetical protein
MSDNRKKHDGGPAFPLYVPSEEDDENRAQIKSGMSLRDWFAGMALANEWCSAVGVDPHSQDAIARRAYQIADAMLAQRKEG